MTGKLIDAAVQFAVEAARHKGSAEATADDLLLGCLRALSRFGVVEIGRWVIDLEDFGVEWRRRADPVRAKVSYAEDAVRLFDRAAEIAHADRSGDAAPSKPLIRIEHLLAAVDFGGNGMVARLKNYGIESATWRAALARLGAPPPEEPAVEGSDGEGAAAQEYLSPEDAAQVLGIHVQTLRGYVRSGKLPASRIAGERAIRIRREDLNKVLEPLQPEG